jgi:hypothetical protein
MSASLMSRIAHPGYMVFIGVAVFCAVRACFADVFIDESESAPSDYVEEKRGLKATKVTRPIMIGFFVLMAAFGIWKMFQP